MPKLAAHNGFRLRWGPTHLSQPMRAIAGVGKRTTVFATVPTAGNWPGFGGGSMDRRQMRSSDSPATQLTRRNAWLGGAARGVFRNLPLREMHHCSAAVSSLRPRAATPPDFVLCNVVDALDLAFEVRTMAAATVGSAAPSSATAENWLHFAADCIFYSVKVCKAPPEGIPALGETIMAASTAPTAEEAAPETAAASNARAMSRRGRSKNGEKYPRPSARRGSGAANKGGMLGARMAPSTKAAVAKLCGSDLYTSRPPHVTATFFGESRSFYTAWHKALRASHSDVDRDGVAFVPISTVEHDNKMLEWGREGVPLCAAGPACAATALANNMGALHAYQLPNDAKPQMFCLLCIRQDIEGLVMSVQARSKTAGACPIIVPPFKNEMGPGGYAESAFGVTPHNQSVFVGNVWIARASNALEVKLNAKTGKCFVDQGPLVYRHMSGAAANAAAGSRRNSFLE